MKLTNGCKYTVTFPHDIRRDYPIKALSEDVAIVGFDYIGDTQLIQCAAENLYYGLASKETKISYLDIDYVITTATKGIPLAQELARRWMVPYICVRKESKVYMDTQVEFTGSSITSGRNKYYISKKEFEALKGKRVIFVDDVFSTGATFETVMKICKSADCKLMWGLFILFENSGKIKPQKSSYNYLWEYQFVPCMSVQQIPLLKYTVSDDGHRVEVEYEEMSKAE